ncbi:MAG: GNAT family acetyltransferase [Chloroflexota bacterium]|jgi:RimJ/RimL family protein N-acetyltransferase|nr:GNAT family N-acetyltransferase [Caldilinea sp.]GIK75779.1 MAG: GNAT family acetyltransferase [Chloroflexota bacterium]
MSSLPSETLALARTLPLKPAPVTLTGRFIRLEPLTPRHAPALFAHSNGAAIELAGRTVPAYDADEVIWQYLFAGPFADFTAFSRYIDETIAGADRLALCVIERESEQPVGVVNLMSNVPAFLRIELGGIWYSPIVQRTQANLEGAYLMLRHCFALGYRRIEWKCDSRNERSRRSALRIGFTFEGVQEYHMIVKGQSRDTAWFRMLDHEWPAAKTRLETMLYGRC